MTEWGDLNGVDHRQALEFFASRLSDISEIPMDDAQLMYNASILAHHANVSTHSDSGIASPSSLLQVFNHYVLDTSTRYDREWLEIAGAQCLMLTGFFADQLQARHNIKWFAKLGADFFLRSSKREPSRPKAKCLYKLSKNFDFWRERNLDLSRDLRDTYYLLFKPS